MLMRYRFIITVVVAALAVTTATAQQRVRKTVQPDTAQIVRNYMDSLSVLRRQLDSVQQVNAALQTASSDGRYYRLFAPLTFYHSSANKSLSLAPQAGDEVTDAIDGALMNIYLKRPDLVRSNESQLQQAGGIRDDVNKPVVQDVDLVHQAAPMVEEPAQMPTGGLVVKKPNFWKFSGDYYLQFLQNYISGNWYKGGESNYSAVGAVTLELNYNDKDRVKFDNKLELKLGFQTSRSDTIHKFKANNDLIRYTGKLGIQAHNRWYYTLQLLAYTQFTRGLKSNDQFTYSDFMSPFNLNIGLGMDYKVETKDKRLTGTINLSPLSYNFRYVGREALVTRYGIDEGKHVLHDIGSQLTVDLEWKLAEQITWKTRLYGYTSYKRAEIEWENTFALKVSKYISANIFVYPRFDDASKRDSDLGYWQFQEYCSLGFAYSF